MATGSGLGASDEPPDRERTREQSLPRSAQAASVVGSVQIRNRATLAGNLCNASPAADTAPALLAYGATVFLIWFETTRSIPVEEFFTGRHNRPGPRTDSSSRRSSFRFPPRLSVRPSHG